MNQVIDLQPLALGDRTFLCAAEHYQVDTALPHPTTPSTHIHDCYEVYLSLSGDISFLINDRLYAMESGDIVIARPREMHVCVVQSPCAYEGYCFWFLNQESSALTAFADGPDMNHHIRFRKPQRDQLIDIVQRLYQEKKAGRELPWTALVYQLLALLNDPVAPEQVSAPAPLPEPLQQVLTYINNHFTEIRTVQEIAGHFYISTATLNRWFQDNLRITPKDYLDSRRLSYSKKLLSQGLSVTDTCDAAGFPSCSRFIAVFKKVFGMTPLKYQKAAVSNPQNQAAG